MKWSFVIQQKIKAAFLLGGIMSLLVLNSFLSRNNILGVDRSVTSIYQDRLIPAIDIILLTESLYTKRLLLERHLVTAKTTQPAIRQALTLHNQKIDSLLQAYEKTYLVERETTSFEALKNRMAAYSKLENNILSLHRAGQRETSIQLMEAEGSVLFNQTIQRLHELTDIQMEVGQELRKASQTEVSRFHLHSTLQIIISIIIGLMVINLIFSARIIQFDSKNQNLN